MIESSKVIDIIKANSAEEVEVVQKYETIDTLWGLDFIKLTDNDIKALKEGKYLYTNNGEYAQLISYEPQSESEKV